MTVASATGSSSVPNVEQATQVRDTSPPAVQRVQPTAGTRRPPQAQQQLSGVGITDQTRIGLSGFDATPILQANIIVMEKIPYQSRANWRMAVAEINEACMLPNQQKKKGQKLSLHL